MKRADGILASLRLVKSSLLTQAPSSSAKARYLHSQVTQKPKFTSPFTYTQSIHFQQRSHFSSKPNTIIELITTQDWSKELEKQLSESNPTPLKHEAVVYVLKKLDKNPSKASDFFNWVQRENGFTPSSPAYNMMLRILGKRDTIKEFWGFIEKMVEEGLDFDGGTYRAVLDNLRGTREATALTQLYRDMNVESGKDLVVQGIVDVVLVGDWNDDVKAKLGEIVGPLKEKTVLRVLRGLARHPAKVLGFFHWVEEEGVFKHSGVTYNKMLLILGYEETMKEFWSVVEDLKSAGHDVDIDTFVKLSRRFQKKNMVEDAVKLYEFMMGSPYKPSIHDCRVLLRDILAPAFLDIDLVLRVLHKHEATGVSLPKTIYDEIHWCFTRVCKFDEAERVLTTMRNAGYGPDNIAYTQVISGLCKERRLEDACQLIDEIVDRGCVTDSKTWSILIEAHCTIDEQLNLFNKMLKKNVEPDARLLEILVDGLCRAKRVEPAYTLLIQVMDGFNVRPWKNTYKCLIEKLLEEKKLENAMNLVYSMKKHKLPASPWPFISYLSEFGTLADAMEFLKAMGSDKQPCPSFSVYFHVLKSFLMQGRESDARNLLKKCPHHIQNHAEILTLFSKQGGTNAIA